MLPSLGCFSSLECPFYNGGAGQCSRPYCHYRHVKRDPNAPPEPVEDVLGPLPVTDPTQTEDISNDGASIEQPQKSRAPMYRAIVEAAPTYNPTPIAILKSSHLPIPYTPTAPTRSTLTKKSKPNLEYVPHCKGPNRPSYPPYCPSSISTLNSQAQSTTPLNDPLKNPLYEIYGPEGAQYSPNDVDPTDTGYSYAPPKNASYAPYSPQYVPCPVSFTPQFSPPDSQPSDEDDNVDLAAEAAAQTNGDSSVETSIIDLDLSELDNLELEYEDDDDNGGGDDNDVGTIENCEERVSEIVNNGSKESSKLVNASQGSEPPQKAKKRRSSSSSSNTESKRVKSSHESDKKNGHKEKKSSSSSKKSSSRDKKSSSHSHSSHSKTKAHSMSSSGGGSHKKSHSSDSRIKSESSSSSSKHKNKHIEKDKDRSRERQKEKDKQKDGGKDKHSSKQKGKSSSSLKSSNSKEKSVKDESDIDRLDEEIRMMEAELDASLEDEDTIEEQCYKMFSEFSESMQKQASSSINVQDQRVTATEDSPQVLPSKKRIAHQASHSTLEPVPKPLPTLAKKCSPYQAMRDRWELLKNDSKSEEKASLAVAPQSVPRHAPPTPYSATNLTSASAPSSGSMGKKRIASVPNVAMLLKPPSVIKNNAASSSASTGTNPARFYSQGSQRIDEYGRVVKVRVAHTPNIEAPAMKKPIVNPSECRKFKAATRQANVNKLYQAYIDAGFGEESHNMALESERSSTQGTESLGVYSHRIIQILKELRACAESSQNGRKLDGFSGIPNRVVSHSAMLAGRLGAKVSWSIETPKKEPDKVSCQTLYEQLQPYVINKELLEENGFPVSSGEKGIASIKPGKYQSIQQPSDPKQRICVRCLKLYSVNKRGEQVKEEECLYHPGRKITVRRYREAESRYTCCDGNIEFCATSPSHVYEPNTLKNAGYMSTLSKPWMDVDPGVYALDCEMCYTTAGLELTRVTVVKDDLSIAYESLVKPAHKILDYNTRFSGITEEDLKGVKTNIIQVQATLLGMFCDKTILIGHSLESDLKALKIPQCRDVPSRRELSRRPPGAPGGQTCLSGSSLADIFDQSMTVAAFSEHQLIHPTIVDTSIVFPHKLGPPYKRALRTLAAELLKKIIQNDIGGHDSKEDAVTAMELMLWRLKEDEKTR